jgi:hypothetical protein
MIRSPLSCPMERLLLKRVLQVKAMVRRVEAARHPSRTKLCGKVKSSLLMKGSVLKIILLFVAYYNAGSAALVLVLVFIVIGAVLWCRRRNNRSSGTGNVRLPVDNRSDTTLAASERLGLARRSSKKGKERAFDEEGGDEESRPIFDVGEESDGEDGEERKSADRYR